MPKVGMKNLIYAPLADDGKKYTKAPVKFSGAISIKDDPQKADEKYYEDDELQDSDNSITSSKINLVVSGDEDAVIAEVLGREYTVTDGAEITNNDNSIFIGIGYINVVRVKGANKYKPKMYYKVKLEEYSDESKTKEDKTAFQTISLDGTSYFNSDGKMKWIGKTCDSVEEAVLALTAKFVVDTP